MTNIYNYFLSNVYVLEVLFKVVLACVIGGIIGNERARHGKDAGIRTHALVCLGSALTSMIAMYSVTVMGFSGDIFRISAQVISGIGFLGAGMIILNNNRVISNLTTAAGIWLTSIIGIGIGYGFYWGVAVASVFSYIVVKFTKRLEKAKHEKNYYVEIDDMSKANKIADEIIKTLDVPVNCKFINPISACNGHLGLSFHLDKDIAVDKEKILSIENTLYIIED